ncbi:hypothetical protein ACIBKY_03495 [Nonomuraea sp. NPDC050394]
MATHNTVPGGEQGYERLTLVDHHDIPVYGGRIQRRTQTVPASTITTT